MRYLMMLLCLWLSLAAAQSTTRVAITFPAEVLRVRLNSHQSSIKVSSGLTVDNQPFINLKIFMETGWQFLLSATSDNLRLQAQLKGQPETRLLGELAQSMGSNEQTRGWQTIIISFDANRSLHPVTAAPAITYSLVHP
jgi:hypothetical protein